mmetsp:Transcript_88284/g.156306  ORF Transcript_88284/g.156306 Transcript_88284/m.156306 type:complete len:230 (-) Transcript_88284:259-948(-)
MIRVGCRINHDVICLVCFALTCHAHVVETARSLSLQTALDQLRGDSDELDRQLHSLATFFLALDPRAAFKLSSTRGHLAIGSPKQVLVQHRRGRCVTVVSMNATQPAEVEIAICTGSSCEQRCPGGWTLQSSFCSLADDTSIAIKEINCMNQCKRGPNVRLVADKQVQVIKQRMNEVEQNRKTFQSVRSEERAKAIWGVAQAIADGSLKDTYGDFTAESKGPLPPSAMG